MLLAVNNAGNVPFKLNAGARRQVRSQCRMLWDQKGLGASRVCPRHPPASHNRPQHMDYTFQGDVTWPSEQPPNLHHIRLNRSREACGPEGRYLESCCPDSCLLTPKALGRVPIENASPSSRFNRQCLGMATQVLIAHTGQRFEVDTAQFSTCVAASCASTAMVLANTATASMISRRGLVATVPSHHSTLLP